MHYNQEIITVQDHVKDITHDHGIDVTVDQKVEVDILPDLVADIIAKADCTNQEADQETVDIDQDRDTTVDHEVKKEYIFQDQRKSIQEKITTNHIEKDTKPVTNIIIVKENIQDLIKQDIKKIIKKIINHHLAINVAIDMVKM